MSTRSLRRLWVVIYGHNCPEGEVENAEKVAAHIRAKLNVVRLLPDNAPALGLLTKVANVVTVGGTYPNRWAYLLNGYVNPRYDITVKEEWDPTEQSYPEWVKAGNMELHGYIKDGRSWPVEECPGKGLIGVGEQPAPRLRPLKVIHIGGYWYCDTCSMGVAFRDDAGPGVYESGCTADIPSEEACPEEKMYTKIADP